MSYRSYTSLTDLILVLQNLDMYFRFYTCLTERILILWILFFCEGTRRYNKSELIIIVSHTGSDQTYADTYQVWTLVHSRYKSQIHYTKVPIGTTGLILILQDLYLFYRYKSTRRYYQTYTYLTDTGVPLGITGLILVLPIREYP